MKSAVGTSTVVLVIGMVFGGIAVAQSTSNTNANIELTRKSYEEVWSKGNMVVADEIYSNDLVRHSVDMPDMKGRDAYKRFILACREAFPDWKETVENIIGSGDVVATKETITGIMTGPLRGPRGTMPQTSKHLALPCAVFFRISEGKIVEIWSYYDSVTFLTAIGVLAPPPPK